jgi:hypothetical protein
MWWKKSNGPHVKYPLFLSNFNDTWIYSIFFFRKILKDQIWWISVRWELSCSIPTDDGRTDMMKLIVAFRNFAEAPQNTKHCTIYRAKQILFISHFNNTLPRRKTHFKPLRFFWPKLYMNFCRLPCVLHSLSSYPNNIYGGRTTVLSCLYLN